MTNLFPFATKMLNLGKHGYMLRIITALAKIEEAKPLLNDSDLDVRASAQELTYYLADHYAAIKAEIEGLTRRLDEIKTEIKETGMAEIVGARNIVTVTLSEPTRFDAATAKSFLTPEQIAACTKTGDLVTTIRVKAVKEAKVIA